MKKYICEGFRFNGYNDHLLGTVGDVHSLPTWLEIAFPGKDTATYFEDFTDKEICQYLLDNACIRLERLKTK